MRQSQALAVMMGGDNVFLTGAPGAGKTYVLNQFIKRAERAGKKVAVTASTGIAASHLGGNTIHSWSGLGIIDELSTDDMKRLAGSEKLKKRYNVCNVLVIDEISMLHGQRLDMINRLAKVLRANDEPFGGLQVILVGDFFQLPPVTRGSDLVDFVYLSEAWQELNPKVCYLTEQHRQSNSDGLLVFLEAMRSAALDDDHYELIKDRLEQSPASGQVVTRLYSHNVDVDAINERHLLALGGTTKSYTMQGKGSKAKLEQLSKGLLVPETLLLKIGAEVMFVANNFSEGFVNGSRGQVIGFQGGLPLVELVSGRRLRVEPHSWSLTEDGRLRAEISQLPLRLAWAITIHKSQGMSLDAAEIDLSRAFTPGMGYVALSRVRSLSGLYVKGLNAMAFMLNPQIHELDSRLRQASVQLAAQTTDIADEDPENDKSSISGMAVDQALLSKLKSWRLARSRLDKLPPYIIAHNTTLEAIATATQPLSEQQLLAIPGFSVRKVEKYGSEVLAIVSAHYY
ncbi:MAG TPA: AAA family ATPase [Candidatus Dormibacteraeota bacterium]|nr:AAA family ATPase [Candidatus Dormibacteraeota bacterium]